MSEFKSLVGEPIPEDELGEALKFEDFNSKEQMMFGWQKVHRELHVVAVAYRRLRAESANKLEEAHQSCLESIADKISAALFKYGYEDQEGDEGEEDVVRSLVALVDGLKEQRDAAQAQVAAMRGVLAAVKAAGPTEFNDDSPLMKVWQVLNVPDKSTAAFTAKVRAEVWREAAKVSSPPDACNPPNYIPHEIVEIMLDHAAAEEAKAK